MMKKLFSISGGILLFGVCAAPNAGSQEVNANPLCLITETEVIAQTIVDTQYTQVIDLQGKASAPFTSRHLWRIWCSLITRDCEAMRLNLKNIERGEPIHFLDITLPNGMQLTSVVGKVATISWPNFVTVTIDLGKNRLEYRESGASAEGVGQGSCEAL